MKYLVRWLRHAALVLPFSFLKPGGSMSQCLTVAGSRRNCKSSRSCEQNDSMIESTKEGAMADYDAVIIGTGFGGSIAAQQLTER